MLFVLQSESEHDEECTRSLGSAAVAVRHFTTFFPIVFPTLYVYQRGKTLQESSSESYSFFTFGSDIQFDL